MSDYTKTQKMIEAYWSDAAASFSEFIQEDLRPERRQLWRNKILANAPQKERLDILDVGTGPGFFAIILSEVGHNVTAIDCSPDMLNEARKNATLAGVDITFMEMECHELTFADNSFDLIVSRNLTWTLYEPLKAYREWLRVLRPDGRFIVFDANYGMYCYDEELAWKKAINEDFYEKHYGPLPSKKRSYENDEYFKQMYLSDKLRPEWDKKALESLGVTALIEKDVSREMLTKPRRLLNSTSPMFMVVAIKQDRGICRDLI